MRALTLVTTLLACGISGCSSHPATGAGGCIDIAGGVDYTTFANRGETAGKGVGEPCSLSTLPLGTRDCADGLCMPDGRGGGFCTKMCASDSDCRGLVCKGYTIRDQSYRSCLAADLEWCSKP